MNQDKEVIKGQEEKCFIGNKEVPCPESKQELNATQQTTFWDQRLLPKGIIKNERNNMIFFSMLTGIIIALIILIVLKVKIFNRTLIGYIKPIWLYILGAILVVFSQYLIVLPYNDKFPYLINISQALWALMVALSVMKLCKEEDFNLGNIFILGIIYSIIIHGLKITIRYLFYKRSLFYVADRFIYGSLLVMLIVIILGPLFIFLRKKNIRY